MTDRITKLQRWIDLIACLVGRRVPVPFEDLMRQVPAYAQKWDEDDGTAQAAVRRMFERDKDELRRHGIPLQTVRYSINFGTEQIEGYRIARRDFYLPYLNLVEQATRESLADENPDTAPRRRSSRDPHRIGEIEVTRDDAALALDALRRVADVPSFPLAAEARSAFRKLAFGLDADAFRLGAPVLFVERPETGELVDRLRALSDALLDRKWVSFRYHGIYRGETTEREVAPYGLLFHHGHWYLVGHDSERDAIRVFRTERMDDVNVNRRSPNTPDFETPASFRIDNYAGREAWELGSDDEAPIRALVRFRWPASLAMARNQHGVLVREEADGSAVRAFEVHQVQPFLRWLLSQEGDASIQEPPELRRALQDLARDVAAAHGGPGAAGASDADGSAR
ncbi:MAG: WYL domain-containing protein [Gemmatimonadetes bacterium]|nr:WYL domain-containing protein [Gemmatimonadota bacterium]